jgi:hypothetical protein
VIYYTTDGTTPTTSSGVYSAPIQVTTSETVKAVAVAPSAQASSVANAAYVIQTESPTVNFPNGFSSTAGLSLQGSAVVTQKVLQLTLASATASRASVWFGTPVNIGSFTTDFNFQLLSAKADGLAFVIQNAGVSALGPGGSGLGYGASQPGAAGGIGKSAAVKFDLYSNDGEGTNSTGLYTNGASPTTPATDMTASGVKLNGGHVLHAHITYDGANLTLVLTDTVTSQSFLKTWAINIPSTVGSGTGYVGFTAATGGLAMTTDILNWTLSAGGTTAGTNAAVANAATASASRLNAPAPEVRSALQPARAEANTSEARTPGVSTPEAGKSEAAPMIALTATEQSVAGEPKFFPQPGVFAGDMEVTLRCDAPGAVIHYTFDGSQPVATSPVYGAPISVKGTELTIKAFASVPGGKDSAVVTGIYRIRE